VSGVSTILDAQLESLREEAALDLRELAALVDRAVALIEGFPK
jgi:hypothetical protein